MIEKITIDPKICHGKPCIRGTRIPIEVILDLLAAGYDFERIQKECYPQLTRKQLTAAIVYATRIIRNEKIFPIKGFKYEAVSR